jgi:transposase
MPTERIEMRRVREMLRLSRDAGLGLREVARRTGVAPSTLREMGRRFERSGLTWPLPSDLTDADLEARLYGEAGTRQGQRRRAEPDWAVVNRELKRKHVTLQILWDEYIEANPDGYRYSRFCDLYRGWEARLPVTMRQTHLGGDKLFVDYAGDTVPVIVDRRTGETRAAHLFVAVMGGSSLTFAHASWTETLPDWIDAHVRAFAFFGGAARLLVPDNPKVAVIKASLYEPQVHRTYGEMAAHYDTAVLPARPRRPRDKAKVEAAVRIVERWLLGRLRNRRVHGLAEVNAAIADLLVWLNDQRVLRHVGRTRRQLFEEVDAPRLKPLPAEPYALAEWRLRKVGLDYHVGNTSGIRGQVIPPSLDVQSNTAWPSSGGAGLRPGPSLASGRLSRLSRSLTNSAFPSGPPVRSAARRARIAWASRASSSASIRPANVSTRSRTGRTIARPSS